jgi:4-amino-4-deoxy-L-arabinose transferase-like glycosyltransferase
MLSGRESYLPFIALLLIYIIGMFIDVMDVDASQYASISREMLESGEYLKLYNRYEDYLDKPPLLFWTAAMSYKLFGISNFSYKLPSVLFTLLGLWSTFRLGELLYNRRAGYYAALVLGSCQAWFLINHDVRTDTILAGSTIFAIWQLMAYTQTNRLGYLIGAAFGIAGAMLTKGPIGLMVPALALGTHFLIRQEWRQVFKWQWLCMLAIVALLISPFLYGLYLQYDLEPGKVINSMVISSGIKFYLWTQSFGRLTGENSWKDDSSVLFFTHTFLWSFLPWSILFLIGFWEQVKAALKKPKLQEWITLGGFVLPFIAFSLSKFKLPHYIYVVFPLAAVSTGAYVDRLLDRAEPNDRMSTVFRWVQGLIVFVLLLLVLLLVLYCFPGMAWWIWIGFTGLALSALWLLFRGTKVRNHTIWPSFLMILAANLALNGHVYPQLLQYQSYKKAALDLRAKGIAPEDIVTFKEGMHSLDFYSRSIIANIQDLDQLEERLSTGALWVYTNEAGKEEMETSGRFKIQVNKNYQHYHVTQLTLPFLNPATRAKTLKTRYVLLLKKLKQE